MIDVECETVYDVNCVDHHKVDRTWSIVDSQQDGPEKAAQSSLHHYCATVNKSQSRTFFVEIFRNQLETRKR